jgi:subtilase family serine protease
MTATPELPALLLASPLTSRVFAQNQEFFLSVDPSTFLSAGEPLTLTASLGDGRPLPDWLTFDSSSFVLRGTPPLLGNLNVRITATNGQGVSISDTFPLTIAKSDTTLPNYAYGHAIAVRENLAILATSWNGITVMDISNPGSPITLGNVDTPGYARDVAVLGTIACVADSEAGLVCVDFSDPSQPQLIGQFVTNQGYLNGVSISGDYAYGADYSQGLLIFDISDPSQPSLISRFDTFGTASNLAVSGTYAYIADLWGGLSVIDVSNPAAPSLVSRINTESQAYGITITDGKAYVQCQAGLEIFGLEDSATPTLLGRYSFPTQEETYWTQGPTIVDNKAYVTTMRSGVHVLDVSNPVEPRLLTVFITDEANDLALLNSNLFVADRWQLRVFDSESIDGTPDKNEPLVLVQSDAQTIYVDREFQYKIPSQFIVDPGDDLTFSASLGDGSPLPSWLAFDPSSRTLSGKPPEIGNFNILVQAIDSEGNSSSDTLLFSVLTGTFDTYGNANDVAVAGSYAYVADQWAGLRILDVSTPDTPREVGFLWMESNADQISVSGGLAYVASSTGLSVIDISEPASPKLIGALTNSDGSVMPQELLVRGGFAYVAAQQNGLLVYDVKTPSAPVLIHRLAEEYGVKDLAIQDQLAYVVTNSGLFIYDLSQPWLTEPIGYYNDLLYPEYISIDGNNLVVGNWSTVWILSLEEPISPQFRGSYDFGNQSWFSSLTNVLVDDHHVYLTRRQSGVEVLDISNPSSPILIHTIETPHQANQLTAGEDGFVYVADGASGIQIFPLLQSQGAIGFASRQFTVHESGFAEVTLKRSGGSTGEVSVTLSLSDGSATSNSDYDAEPFAVVFADGQTTSTVRIPIVQDSEDEAFETIQLNLANTTGGASIGSTSTSSIIILPTLSFNGSAQQLQQPIFEFVETLQVDSRLNVAPASQPKVFSSPLESGRRYKFSVSGQFTPDYRTPFGVSDDLSDYIEDPSLLEEVQWLADARYVRKSPFTEVIADEDQFYGDFGLFSTLLGDNSDDFWGGYSQTGEYVAEFVGTGSSADFFVNDINYDDNFGKYTIGVSRARLAPSPIINLTTAAAQTGSTFTELPVSLGLGGSFSSFFQFQISNSQGLSEEDGTGGDGLVFVLQSTGDANILGEGGGMLGYQGIGNSLGIEFDTWNNGSIDDYNGNHVGINFNGSVDSNRTIPISTPFNNGEVWSAWVDYDGVDDVLQVRLSPNSDQRPYSPLFSQSIDLGLILNLDQVRVGFTAATGGASGQHDILNWNFDTTSIPVLPRPNLVITTVDAPGYALQDSVINVSWTVQNQGSGLTLSSSRVDRIYFSRDNLLDGSDYYLTEVTSSSLSLPPGRSSTLSIDLPIATTFIGLDLSKQVDLSKDVKPALMIEDPTPGFGGDGYLLFVSDIYDQENESNESDNTYAHPFTIITSNLSIQSVEAPASAISGETLNLSWTVTNDGAFSTTHPYIYDDFVFSKNDILGDDDDIFLASEFVSEEDGWPLAPGATYTKETSFTLPPQAIGSGYILVTTDRYGYQLESNESDNTYPHAIYINGANLLFTEINAPSTAVAGQAINLSWSVKNESSFATQTSYYYDDVVFSRNQIFGDSDDVLLVRRYVDSSLGLPLDPTESYSINQDITLPQGVVGEGYLLFKTDSFNYQGETNENDNVQSQAINILAPNLKIQSATAPEAAILGQTISVSWSVINNGSVSANADWYDSIYLSDNSLWDASDIRIDSFWQAGRSPLDGNASYTDTRSVVIPASATPGNKFLIFVTDYYGYLYYGQQGETDETDNISSVPIVLSAPDLIVSAANSPSSAVVNGTINISWTVTNQSSTEAPANWYDRVFLSSDTIPGNGNDIYLYEEFINSQTPLAANGTYLVNRNISIPNVAPGNYYLFVSADVYNQQGETNNNNNSSQPISLSISAPDLIVSEASAPEAAALGALISLSWTVNNQGGVNAPADWTDYIYWSSNDTLDWNDLFITSVSAAAQTPLLAGQAYTKSQNITLPSQVSSTGAGYLIIVADGNSAQGETNENNNRFAIPFRLDAPDLIVSAGHAPTSVTVGATININWDVKNTGTVSANGDWYDRVVISTDQIYGNSDDTYLTEVWQGSLTPLPAGSSYNRSLNLTLPSTATGDRFLLFKTDQYNQQGETDENNNILSRPINISASDLQITATNSPGTAILGETIELTWTVANNGTGIASQDWYDRVYLSTNQTLDGNDVFVTAEFIASQTPLATGSSYTISKNVNLPSFAPGNQYLLFVTDRDNYQGEINENNNLLAVPINLTAPDLVVSVASAAPVATVGQSTQISWTVHNQGTSSAPADWYDRIYLSNDAILDLNSDVYVSQELISAQTPLAAGGSYSVTRSINLPNFATGNRYLIVVTDGTANQGETNETNNTRAIPISLNSPDLIVSDISVPVETLSGQPLEISWTIKNQGTGSAEGIWRDYVYLLNTETNATQAIGLFDYSGGLAAGASLTRTQSYNVPLGLIGNYRVVVTTDYSAGIAEGIQNESNNTSTDDRPISIQLSPVPNLQVTGVTAPSLAFSGQETRVEWTIKNIGVGATNAPVWYDRVYLSLDSTFDNTDTYLGHALNPSYLNPGESYSNSLAVTLPKGIDNNYFFLIQADAYNYVVEVGNENDNWAAGGPTDVQLTPPPDLQVTSVQAPSIAFSGQPMNLSWTVSNSGSGRTAETSWYDRVYMSSDSTLDAGDRVLGDFFHNGLLDPGQSYTSQATVNLPIGVAGGFFMFIKSDIYNNVYEHIFEENNAAYDLTATTITLTPPPDLEFESLVLPSQARSGGILPVSYRVTNFGATETPTQYWVDKFYLSIDHQLDTATDLLLGTSQYFGTLQAGEGYDRNLNFSLPNTLVGAYYLFGVTDSGDQVFELNNTNNILQSVNKVQIASQPADLVVSEVILPTVAEAGKSMQVNWTVNNQGAGDTIATTWTDRIVISTDSVLGDADDISLANYSQNGILAPGASYTRTENIVLPFTLEGSYQLFVVTDATNNVYEFNNENNNSTSASPLLVSRNTPDLQVTNITLPDNLLPGQSLPLSWTVTNMGVGQTNSNFWYDRVYLSSDQTLSGDDTSLGSVYRSGALTASGSYTATAAFSLPPDLSGNYYVLVQTDRDNHVIEGSFEANNITVSSATSGGNSGTGTILISPAPTADLVILSVDAPAQAIAGQSMSLSWSVGNNSASTANSWFDSIYLSRDQVFERNNDIYLGFRNHAGGLTSGSSYTANQSFTLPRGLGGRFYVFVVTDSGNSVYERLAESNNISYDGFSTDIILPPPVDLTIGAVTIPVSGTPGQTATISYTVNNQSVNEAIGTWEDTIYLSNDQFWDVDDAFFGRVSQSGPLAGGTSYSNSLSAPLPGVATGDYYVIVRSDIRNYIPESDENNNLKATVDDFSIDVEQLTLGVQDTSQLRFGQSLYYRVDVPGGETLAITLDGAESQVFSELYVSRGEIPNPADFDYGSILPFSSDQRIVIPSTDAGTYYIQAIRKDRSTTNAEFNVKAELIEFSVFDTSFGQGGNLGRRTIEINGAKFDRSLALRLRDGSGLTTSAVNVYVLDSTKAYATFDLLGLSPGQYDVIIENGEGETISLVDSFEVVEGGGSNVIAQVDAPRTVGRNRGYTFTASWYNDGINDAPTPILRVENTGSFGFYPGDTSASSSYNFFGYDRDGILPGILLPGQFETITFFGFSDNNPGNYTVAINRLYKDENALFDWDILRPQLKSSEFTDVEFETIFQQLIDQVGNTNGDYLRMLSENAALLPEELGSPNNIGDLLEIEFSQARAAVNTSMTGRILANNLDVDISGRSVTATNDENQLSFQTVTLNDGTFVFEHIPEGTYRFVVQSAQISSQTPVLATVHKDEALSGIEIPINNGASIKGSITQGTNNSPSKDSVVRIHDSERVVASVRPDLNGDYSVIGLSPGMYTLEVESPNQSKTWVSNLELASQTVIENIALLPESKVIGAVVDSNGQFLDDVLILAQLEQALPNSLFAGSTDDGSFALDSLGAGTYDIVVVSPNEDLSTKIIENVTVPTSGVIDLGTIALSPTVNAKNIDPEEAENITTLGFPDWLDLLELNCAPVIIAEAAILGGMEAASLYSRYFDSTSPNGIVSIAPGSSITSSFKNHSVTTRNINTIQTEVVNAIKAQWSTITLPCEHDGIDLDIPLNSLTIPSQNLLYADGSQPSSQKDAWNFPFWAGAAGVLAGGVGSGGPPPLGALSLLDSRAVNGFAKLHIPAGSSSATVSFDLDVTVVDTVDFDPGNIVFSGSVFWQARVLERNARAFDVPFKVSFKPDTQTFSFSINLDDEECEEEPDDDDPIERPTSVDPNDILGPTGFGENRWISAANPLAYTIRFENDPVFATAPAQVVRITQKLDDDLDFRTFRLGDFGFSSLVIDVPDNRSFYQGRVDLTASNGIYVDVSAGIDVISGEVFWELTTVDPATGELPIDALAGFLPPNLESPEGEGFVKYSVRPKRGIETGAVIDAEAVIVFDSNEPISTPPIFNTIDVDRPTGEVNDLPAITTTSDFLVSWSGGDSGSSLSSFTVFVSDNGEAYAPWLTDVTHTEEVFVGQAGHTYRFYAVAKDQAGNLQIVPAEAQSTTTVQSTTNQPPVSISLLDSIAALPENFSTAVRTKLADIQIIDDGIGFNHVSLSGFDAASFEVDGDALYLRPGVILDYESGKILFSIVVDVDDSAVGTSPDLSLPYQLGILNVDDTNDGSASFLIDGTAAVGHTLSAKLVSNDPDGNGVGGFGYRWQTSADGANWSEAGSASSYTLAAVDEGKQVRLVVSYTDGQGFAETVTTPVVSVPFVNNGTASFFIQGTAEVGSTLMAQLTGTDPDGDGAAGFFYTWEFARPGGGWSAAGTEATYTVASEDEGKDLRLVVNYTDAEGFSESLIVSAGRVPFVNNGAATVSIDGTAMVGNTLNAMLTSNDPDGNGDAELFDYSWQTSNDGFHWSEVGKNSLYTVADGDQGRHLQLVLSYVDGEGFTETIADSTGMVPFVNNGQAIFLIGGFPEVGATVSVELESNDPDGSGMFSYSWLTSLDGSDWDIVGFSSVYEISEDDQGKQLRAVIEYIDSENFAESVVVEAGLVASAPPINHGSVSFLISGTAALGNTLTAQLVSNDPDGNGEAGFRTFWQTSSQGGSWSEIGTEATYTVAAEDEGKDLRLVVSYIDGEGFAELVTTPLVSVPFMNNGSASFSIIGTTAVGNTLSAQVASNDPDGNGAGGFDYRWQTSTDGSSWSEVGTASSYTLAMADEGKQLQLVVGYIDGQGFSESVTTSAGLVPLLPLVSISGPTVGLTEGNSGSMPHPFSITRSGDLSIASSVHWAVNGTGANPATSLDFAGAALPSGLAVFAAGQDTFPLSINVVGDGLLEADESFSVSLASPIGARLSPTTSVATSVILNDDLPQATYTLSASADPVYEGHPLRIGLSTTNVEAGRSLYWQLGGAGITSADVSDGVLNGTSLIGVDGRAAFLTTLAADGVADPDERLDVRFFLDSARTQQVGGTLQVTIKELSPNQITEGNDAITGTALGGPLTGVPVDSILRGRRSVDRLQGAEGVDTFVLGDAQGPYYNDGTSGLGTSDLAVIINFNAGDRIQLYGSSTNYSLVSGFYNGTSGVRINLRTGTPLPQTGGGTVPLVGNEAIGFIEGATLGSLNLSSASQFQYTI